MAFTWSPRINGPVRKGNRELAAGVHKLNQNEIPSSWFSGDNLQKIRWNKDHMNLPSDPTGKLLSLRGTDIPSFPMIKTKHKMTKPPAKMGFGSLLVIGEDKSTALWGGPDKTPAQGQVKFCIQMESQLPSLSMKYSILMNGQEPAAEQFVRSYRVLFHGNTGMLSTKYISPSKIAAGKHEFEVPAIYEAAAKEGRLLAIEIAFGSTLPRDRFLNCITVLYGRKGTQEFNRWKSNDDMRATMGQDAIKMSGFDGAVKDMFTGRDVRLVFLRQVEKDDIHVINQHNVQYQYWAHNMTLSIPKGPFWWYRLQARFNQNVSGAHFSGWDRADMPPPVPFWLVKSFVATVDSIGIKELMPLEWAGMVPNPSLETTQHWALPHPELLSLLQELSLVREKAWQAIAAKMMFETKRLHYMSVRPVHVADIQVILRLDIIVVASIEEGTQSNQGVKILPPPHSTLKARFNFGPNLTKTMTISGLVVDDLTKPDNIDLVVYFKLPTKNYVEIGQFFDKLPDGQAVIKGNGTLQVMNNYMSINRSIAGFRGIAANLSEAAIKSRVEAIGSQPDPKQMLLGYDPRFQKLGGEQIHAIDKCMDFAKSQGLRSIEELFDWFGFPKLNAAQKGSIFAAIEAKINNVTVIHGPPATGKSQTLACLIMLLHFVFKAKIAVCAPSNQACNALMDKTIEVHEKWLWAKSSDWNVHRFVTMAGTPVSEIDTAAGADNEDIDIAGLEELALARRHMVKMPWKSRDYSFHEAKAKYAEEGVKFSKNASFKYMCTVWLSCVNAAGEDRVFGNRRKDFRAADRILAEHVLEKTDVLIGTLNSMAREELEGAKFDTLIIDEAAQASVGDIAIPFNTFKGSLVRAVLAGDDYQLSAFMGSQRANETAQVTSMPLFREVRNARHLYSVHLLNEQYRCHPHLYGLSNRHFYEEKVTSAAFLADVTPLDTTLGAFFQQQIGHAKFADGSPKWGPKDWPRFIAVDINVASRLYPGTASSENAGERNFLVWLRQAMLDFTVPPGGVAVTKEDFGMISPYRGQVASLKNYVGGEAVIQTVARYQGSQCPIGMSSFAKNDPEQPLAIGIASNPPILNVWTTRPMRFHIMVGNFVARHRRLHELKKLKGDQRAYTALLREVFDRQFPGSICVCSSDFVGWKGGM